MRVLICDDDPVIRYLLTVVLGKRAGDDVIEVADADDVLGAALEHRPDVIVLDYVMPNRDGADVVIELRMDPVVGTIPVVFLTGRSDIAEETLDEIAVAGLIEKPFEASKLHDRLEAFVAANITP